MPDQLRFTNAEFASRKNPDVSHELFDLQKGSRHRIMTTEVWVERKQVGNRPYAGHTERPGADRGPVWVLGCLGFYLGGGVWGSSDLAQVGQKTFGPS